MVIVSTVDTVTLIVAFTIGHGSIFNNGSLGLTWLLFQMAEELCVIFANWGADGFMVSILKQRLDVADHLYLFC